MRSNKMRLPSSISHSRLFSPREIPDISCTYFYEEKLPKVKRRRKQEGETNKATRKELRYLKQSHEESFYSTISSPRVNE